MQIASDIWTQYRRCSSCSIPVALIVQIATELWSKNARSKIQAQKTQKMNPLSEVICLAFRVVAWGVRRSVAKCEFSMLLVVLWHCKTGPWRESCESTRKLWFFGVSEVWKCTFSPGTANPCEKWAKWRLDLPKSTLAVQMAREIR